MIKRCHLGMCFVHLDGQTIHSPSINHNMRSIAQLILSLGILFVAGCATPAAPKVTPNANQTPAASATVEESDRVITLNGITILTPEQPGYLREKLAYFGLTPLAETPKTGIIERYRFLYCRWIAPAGLFEIEFHQDGSGTYRSLIWTDKSNDPRSSFHTTIWSGKTIGTGHWTEVKTRGFSRKELDFLRVLVSRWKLYELPWHDGRGAFDGSSWFIELVSGEKHHEIFRESPEDGPVRWFGTKIIELSIDSPFIPIQ